MAQKLKKIIIVLCSGLFISGYLLSSVAFALRGAPPASTTTTNSTNCNVAKPTATTLNSCVKQNVIIQDLNVIVNILGAVVGVVVTGAIILGGIQYSMAGDSPDAVGKAKKRITNGLFALVAFLLVYAFLQWIVPGGVFSNS
jgi:hypothetical protein